MTRIFLTGYNGLLGQSILRCKLSDNITRIIFEKDKVTGYRNLNDVTVGTILHCGAVCDNSLPFPLLFRYNVEATEVLIEHVKAHPKLKIVFTSANSIHKLTTKPGLGGDKYSFTKKLCEELLEKRLPRSQYTAVRLPGLYLKGHAGKGFIDKLYYESESIIGLNYRHKFNNMALVRDVADFLSTICSFEGLGHIGSLATFDWLTIDEIAKFLGIPDKEELGECQYYIPSGDNVRAAFELGYPRRGTMELLNYLYK